MKVDPYFVVRSFEETIADYCGSKFSVAVESCTSALFLSLMYQRIKNNWHYPAPITIPANTYPGVACSIIHAGYFIREFSHEQWEGEYKLGYTNIWDAALRFKRGMYNGGFQCISFHAKKILAVGRGGMILTDDENAAKWLRKARFDGRNPVPLQEDNFTMLGWNCYLQPEQAARGLMLMQSLLNKYPDGPPDLKVEDQKYPDLSKFKIYTQS